MASDMALNPTQTISLLSNGKSPQTRTESAPPSPPPANEAVVKDVKTGADDTVSLSPQVLQALADAERNDAKKRESQPDSTKETSNRSAAKVEFVYDLKGELITRYLDTANRLVYQTPSELMLLMKGTDSKSKAAVNTKV